MKDTPVYETLVKLANAIADKLENMRSTYFERTVPSNFTAFKEVFLQRTNKKRSPYGDRLRLYYADVEFLLLMMTHPANPAMINKLPNT